MGLGDPTPATRVRRAPHKARYDDATVHAIIDAVPFCHVAAVVAPDDVAIALPFLHARVDSTVLLHGSRSNRLLAALVAAPRTSATFTTFDGLRIARTGFESSVAYRSCVVFGRARLVTDHAEREAALDALVEAILPGRSAEIRAATDRELSLTTVLALEIEGASAKVSAGPTEDADEDKAEPVWAGDLPASLVYGQPVPATDGAMASTPLAVPASVRRLAGRVVGPTVAS